MSIIKVANLLFDDRYGGPQKRAISVAKELKKNNVKTYICIPERGGNVASIAKENDLEVITTRSMKIPRLNNKLNVIVWLLYQPIDIVRYIKLFRLIKPDIAHVNGAFFISPIVAAKIYRIPVVWHLNDTIVPKPIASILGILVKKISTKIVVAAEAVASYYSVNDCNYQVIYAPVDVSVFNINQRWAERVNNNDNKYRIGLIANWNKVKGLEYFIEAAGYIKQKYNLDIKYVLAGMKVQTQSEYIKQIENQITNLELEKNIEYKGFVKSISTLMNNLDIVVLTSISEASPMSVLEGMASGIPVVATNVGGVKEILKPNTLREAGIVVPPRDSRAISEAIISLINNPNVAKRMGKMGRELSESEFSLQVCSEKHFKLYASLVNTN